MIDLRPQLRIALAAATAAGNLLAHHSEDMLYMTRNRKESLRDIATAVDTYAEQTILETIRAGDPASILTEESGAHGALDPEHGTYWVVDPLDGTVNYVNHIPLSAVSIAYVREGVPVVGVVYNPFLNELYYGADDLGVYRNHTRIALPEREPREALYAMTFSGTSDRPDRRGEFDVFRELNDATMGCLRTGSAAINLAYVAEGRLGGCLGRSSRLWDVMAGFVLARLAGARIESTIVNAAEYRIDYIAAAPQIYPFLEDLVGRRYE